ncbi:MAG: SDR family oxidoreductase [Burkholderiaceae bacterium]|jgi:short-subunit dehydrogenase|nr:SDR family oxidoreductase [Burkholderiaceae bacterium]
MNARDMSVLLTGASGGIGAALATALCAAGARVLLVARRAEPLTKLAATLAARPDATRGQVAALPADITRAADRQQLAQAALDRDVNVLINNAGAPCFGAFASMNDADIAQALLVNLVAPMQLTHALLPQLAAHPRSRVLNVGSALGRLGLPGHALYGAAKFGLRGFSEALRRELAGSGLRVQYLGPRATRTGFNDARVAAYNAATGAASDAPERVAQAALALLESGAAERYIGFPESLAVCVNGLVPHWLDGAFGRHAAALRALDTPSRAVATSPQTSPIGVAR